MDAARAEGNALRLTTPHANIVECCLLRAGRVLVLAGLLGLAISVVALGNAKAGDCGDGNDQGDVLNYACGKSSNTYGTQSTTLGNFATTGTVNTPSDSDNTAVGFSANAFGQSLAIGSYAKAGSDSPLAQNRFHTAIGTGAEAGQGADGQLYSTYSTALGYFAKANADRAVALGADAEANFLQSVALGQNVKTTRNYQVLIGDGANTYTLAGVASDASKAAQEGTKYLMTTDATGNLAASTFDLTTLEGLPDKVNQNSTAITNLNTTVSNHTTQIANNTELLGTHTLQIADLDTRVTTNTTNINLLDGRVGSLESSFQDIGNQISENRTEARAGTALALATAGLRYDDRPGKLSLAGGFGHFKGQSGMALGLGYNTSEEFRMNAAVSATTGRGDVGVSVGASWTLN